MDYIWSIIPVLRLYMNYLLLWGAALIASDSKDKNVEVEGGEQTQFPFSSNRRWLLSPHVSLCLRSPGKCRRICWSSRLGPSEILGSVSTLSIIGQCATAPRGVSPRCLSHYSRSRTATLLEKETCALGFLNCLNIQYMVTEASDFKITISFHKQSDCRCAGAPFDPFSTDKCCR